MTEVAFKSAGELARMIRNKEISSLELADHYVERIEKFDGALNAVVVRDFERARRRRAGPTRRSRRVRLRARCTAFP